MDKIFYKVWYENIKYLRKFGLEENKIYHWTRDFKDNYIYIAYGNDNKNNNSYWGFMYFDQLSFEWFINNNYEYKGEFDPIKERKEKLQKIDESNL